VLRMMNNGKIDKLVVIVVNAATNPDTDRDKTARVPGLIDTLTTAATVPLGNYTADTLDLLTATVNQFNEEARLVEGCKKIAAAQGAQCAPNVQVPHKVELYPIQVAFEYIASADERNWFKNLPTSFELPRDTIDRLRAVGRRLLAEDAKFQELMKTLSGCLPANGRAC
jgi:NTE family protein